MKQEIQKINDIYKKYINIIPMENEWDETQDLTVDNLLGGNIVQKEAKFMFNFFQKYEGANILQIGTYIGFSGAIIATVIGPKGKLTIIDPNHPHRCVREPLKWAKQIYKELGLNNVEFIEGYSNSQNTISDTQNIMIKTDISEENVLDRLQKEDKKYDIIFIDGNHDFLIVFQDIVKSMSLLKNRGYILCHDIRSAEGVSKAINAVFSNNIIKEGFCYTSFNSQRGIGIIEKVSDKEIMIEIKTEKK